MPHFSATADLRLALDPGRSRPPPLRPPAIARGGWMRREQHSAGGGLLVELWAEDRTRGAAAIATLLAEVQRIERRFGAERADSELAAVNAAAAAQPVALGDEGFQLLARAQEFARNTQGAFDVTIGAVSALHAAGRADDLRLARALPLVDWQQLQLDPLAPAVRFARTGMRVDLGGMLRAHAIDRGVALLQRLGIRHALVRAGGDLRVLGEGRGRIAAALADDPGELGSGYGFALARCGRPRDPARVPVLDPRTGRPATALREVTVLASEALVAAAMAKAAWVLGAEAAAPMIERQRGVQARMIDAQGREHRVTGAAPVQAPWDDAEGLLRA